MLYFARLKQIFFVISPRPTIKIIQHHADQWAPCADQWALFICGQIMIVLFYCYFRLLNFLMSRHRLCINYIVPGLVSLSKGNLCEGFGPDDDSDGDARPGEPLLRPSHRSV
jgi:hypothetical protein